MIRTTGWRAVCLGVVCLALAGCTQGEKLTKVRGKVVENGQPIVIQQYEEGGSCLQVMFVPLDEAGKIANGPVYSDYATADGVFEITGDMGDGIPLRKYRMVVRRVGQTPGGGIGDLWNGKFDAQKSTFSVDVTGSEGEVVIDIAKAPSA